MNYLRPHNRALAGWKRTALWVLGFFLVAFALIEWRWPNAMPGLATAIARPFWRVDFAVQSGALRSPEQLLAENESLRQQLADLQAITSTSSIGTILAENAELMSSFNRASSTPRTLAAVLARPPFVPYDELVIDIGLDHGLASTSLVYAPGNILIGRVVEVLGHSAKVALFSSSGQKYDVLIGSSHVPATAIGKGGGQYEASVPHGSVVQEGDTVSDASLRDGPFGSVVSIFTDPSNPFDTVLFATPVNLYQLRWVTVSKQSHG